MGYNTFIKITATTHCISIGLSIIAIYLSIKVIRRRRYLQQGKSPKEKEKNEQER